MAMRDAQNRYALAERELKDLTDLNKVSFPSLVYTVNLTYSLSSSNHPLLLV